MDTSTKCVTPEPAVAYEHNIRMQPFAPRRHRAPKVVAQANSARHDADVPQCIKQRALHAIMPIRPQMQAVAALALRRMTAPLRIRFMPCKPFRTSCASHATRE